MIRLFPALISFAGASRAGAPTAEGEWIARAQRGDGAAFRVLFDLHAPAVHRFLRDLLGDAAAADESTQETFVRAYQRLRRLAAEERFRPWVLGIARNVFREHCRRRKYAPLGSSASEDESAEPTAEELAQAGRVTPESALLDRERVSQLEDALARLSADRREVLLLRFDHELSCADVAEVLGWSVAKVKVEVHRARAQLRELLDGGGRHDL